MVKIILVFPFLFFIQGFAHAIGLYGVKIDTATGTAEQRLAGLFCASVDSGTWDTCVITLDGPNTRILVGNGVDVATITATDLNIATVTATYLYGDGSGITGVVDLSDDYAWTGVHSWTSSATFSGSNFSIGGSTFVVVLGRVGIGTTAPSDILHVYEGNDTTWSGRSVFSGLTNAAVIGTFGGIATIGGHNAALDAWRDLYFNDATNDNGLVIKAAGNVGIGTTNPTEKLHIVGNSYVTGQVKSTGNIITSGQFIGDGSGLTVMTAANISAGTLGTSVVVSSIAVGVVDRTSHLGDMGCANNFILKYVAGTWGCATDEGGVGAALQYIQDGDADTIVSTEREPDGDTIHFIVKGSTRIIVNTNFVFTGSSFVVQSSGADISFSTSAYAPNLFVRGANGNVGIGTTLPQSKVDIRKATTLPGIGWGHLSILSSDSLAANKGGVVNFGGIYTGVSHVDWAGIAGLKENAVDGQYGGYLALYTRAHGSSTAEKMRILANGNVGIGTTNPQKKLQINVTGSADGIRIDGTNNPALSLYTSGVLKAYLAAVTSAGGFFTGSVANDIVLKAESGNLALVIGGTSRLFVKTDGNVGIGTTNPLTRIAIPCPAGFTSIETQGHQLGCIQNDEEGTTTWYGARDDCWTTYGGRLPTTQEWDVVCVSYSGLSNLTDDTELTGDIFYEAAWYAVGIDCDGSPVRWDSRGYSASTAYRCWIPRP